MSYLKEALGNQFSEDDGDFSNPLLGGGLNSRRPDEDTKPSEVILGDDGQYYFSFPTWNAASREWEINPTFEEPAYYVRKSDELGDVNSERFDIDQYGNVVTKDAGFMADAGGWLSRGELMNRWNADRGMNFFKQAHPDMTFEDYANYINDATQLKAQGVERMGEEGVNQLYKELDAKYGVQQTWQNNDGDTFKFNGGGFTKTAKVDDSFDVGGFVGTIALAAVTAGAAAALAPALAGAIGVSNGVAKGLISAGLQIAQDGEVDIGTALSIAGGSIPGVGALNEVTDVSQDVIDSALDAVVGELTNPNNYRQDDNNQPVFTPTEADITGETEQNEDDEFVDEFGTEIDITMPQFPMPDDGAAGGGGGGDDGEEETGGAPEGGAGGDVLEGDNTSPSYYEIDELGDVRVIDPETGTWNEDGTWGGDYREEPIGNVNDERNEELGVDPWWIGKGPGTYGEHGESTVGESPVGPGAPTPTPDAESGTGEEESGNTLPNIVLGGGEGAGGTGGTGGSGSGAGAGSPGTGGGSGGGSGTGTGPGTGPGMGPGSGGGEGDGDLGGEQGMLGGGGGSNFTFSDLFPYTQITQYQAKALKPVANRIKEARGLINDIFGDS